LARVRARWAFAADRSSTAPGNAEGYNFAARLLPPVPGLARGGRTQEALRVPRNGKGLRSFLRLDDMPGSGAGGDWLRRIRTGKGKTGRPRPRSNSRKTAFPLETKQLRNHILNLTCKIVLGYVQTKASEALPFITS
jgi:hypothetical protein